MEVLVSLAIISLVFVIILQIFSQGLSNIGSYKEYNKKLIEEKRILGYIWYAHSAEMLRKYDLRAKETKVKNLYIINGESIQGEVYRFFAP